MYVTLLLAFIASMVFVIGLVLDRDGESFNNIEQQPAVPTVSEGVFSTTAPVSFIPTQTPQIKGSPSASLSKTPPILNVQNRGTPPPPASMNSIDDDEDLNLRMESFTKLLITISNEDDLLDPSTPQYAARTWIASEDSMQLDPKEEQLVRQRFIMAVFYFSTARDNEWKICGKHLGDDDNSRESFQFQNCARPDGTVFSRHLSGVDECDWYGVVCDEILNVVTSIEIVENGLSGTLPSELSELNYLEYLDLSHNYLKGPLPVLSERNRDLRKINLSNNTFTGTIPPSYGIPDKLRTLELGHNKLTGTIPSTLFTSGTLRHLLLNDNFFTGELPKELFETLSLQQLHLGDNDFGGEISSSFEKLRGLRALFLPNIGFTGSLPGSLFMLSKLEYLSIEGNKVEGTIPTELFDGASKESLIYLNLGFNELAGGMSSRFAELTRLQFLGLNDNYFTGTIPSSLGEISSLTKVFLQNNAFFGNANFMCANDISGQLGALKMDCKEEVTCSCCTFCN